MEIDAANLRKKTSRSLIFIKKEGDPNAWVKNNSPFKRIICYFVYVMDRLSQLCRFCGLQKYLKIVNFVPDNVAY